MRARYFLSMKMMHRSVNRVCIVLLLCLALVAGPAFSVYAQEGASSQSASGDASGSGADSGVASAAGGEEVSSGPLAANPVPGEALYAPNFAVQAEGVCLVNEETGLVVYEKNADTPMVSASLVKMMTCIVAMEHVQNIDTETVQASDTWVFDQLYGKNASHADIRMGETLTVRELLYGMLLPSANEAALLLALYVAGGNIDNFLYMMEARAAALGCTGTVFADPNGLSEDNRITARDATLIMRAFMGYPVLMEIAGTDTYEMAAHEKHAKPYYITATDKLIVPNSAYYSAFPGMSGAVLGGKTGSLGEWQNFVSAASKDGAVYICAVLHSPDAADTLGPELTPEQVRPALYETAALYDWAYSALSVRPALDTTQPITEIRVKYTTDTDAVKLLPRDDLSTVLPVEANDSMIEKKFDLPEFLAAPVKKGDVIGTVTLSLGGEVIGTSELIASQDAKRNNTLYVMNMVGEFFRSVYLRVAILLILLALGGYAGVVFYMHQRRQKRKNTRGRRD